MKTKINNRIFLLYPPISKKERYSSDIGNAGGEQLPLGIFSLAAYLRENGYQPFVTDAEAEKLNLQTIIKKIRKIKPLILGISSTTVAFHRAVEIATEIKKRFPKIVIVLGGPHVTSNVNHAMSFKCFDFGVLREGEITLLELLKNINNKKEFKNIKGLAFRERSKIIVNPQREYIMDLDTLPFPAYDLAKDIKFYSPDPSAYKAFPVANVMTSRGCPNQCTFCDRNVFGQMYREISAKKVVEQIKYLINTFGIKEIAFIDDTFMINKKRLREIFDTLEKENIYFPWTCLSRVNVVDYETLKYIKEKGCWHIAFGIESGDKEILKRIKKGITLKQIKDAIEWCWKLGIKTKGFFIIGHPGETKKTIEKTIKLACKLNFDNIVATINTPIPGSPQYGFIRDYGDFDETDWSQFNYWRPVFIPKGLTKEYLMKKHKEMYRRFYLRPRVLLRYVKSFFGKGGLRRMKSVFLASGFLVAKNEN